MSKQVTQSPESEILKGLESLNIRDRVPMPYLITHQIRRCNESARGIDQSIFETDVRILMTYLPRIKRDDVYKREAEYNKMKETWEYKENCGIKMGTPEDPVLDNDPNDLDYDPDKPTIIISPIFKSKEETDYEKLYEIIMDTLESTSLTWQVEQKTVEMGKVLKGKVPNSFSKRLADTVATHLLEIRKRPGCGDLSYDQILDALKRQEPSTPKLIEEGQEYLAKMP